MSLPEVLLWQRLRGAPQGIAFRKQHPIDPYVVDFYCPAGKLVIEIDGKAHDMGERPKHDDERTAFLERKGYSLLRIAAQEVLRDPDQVAASVVAYVADPLHQHASRVGPPPHPGEDCHG